MGYIPFSATTYICPARGFIGDLRYNRTRKGHFGSRDFIENGRSPGMSLRIRNPYSSKNGTIFSSEMIVWCVS